MFKSFRLDAAHLFVNMLSMREAVADDSPDENAYFFDYISANGGVIPMAFKLSKEQTFQLREMSQRLRQAREDRESQ